MGSVRYKLMKRDTHFLQQYLFMGYIMESYHFYGFKSDSTLRNTFGIDKELITLS